MAPGSTHDRIQKHISSHNPTYGRPEVMITTQEAVGKGSIFLVRAAAVCLGTLVSKGWQEAW